ncbi:MAG: 3-phosphoshikimate 1-carboxyvinyltransferase, partial [Gammaproteobacteria bacterium]|nr:3-phosphoshikimate 1-carboxyvinyltransferase [Gammaproteobacteria bacterium]
MNLKSFNSELIKGSIVCPGDKSISQRILILGWLLNKNITISGFLNAEDPLSTANALNQISDSIQINGNEVIIKERTTEPKNPDNPIDLGNSGTGMRLMFGLISGLGIEATLIGDDSLSQRPMRRLADPLKEMGASNRLNRGGIPPIKISKGKIIDDFVYEMPVASAQVKSSIILAAI